VILDLVVIALMTVFAVVGAFDGALAQGARLLAALGAGLLGRTLGAALAPWLAAATGLPVAIAAPLAVAISCVGLYLLLHFVGRRIARGLTRNHDVRAIDRGTGAFFGALQAAVIAWVLLSILVGVEDRVRLPLGGETSLAASLVRRHNFFSTITQVRDREGSPRPVGQAGR
jgi:uncharacterized membrane protein required for colicin V production